MRVPGAAWGCQGGVGRARDGHGGDIKVEPGKAQMVGQA